MARRLLSVLIVVKSLKLSGIVEEKDAISVIKLKDKEFIEKI
jgi:hypothetical protein